MIWLITIIGFTLRLILINQSFWLDEAASLDISTPSFIGILRSVEPDIHPPLFYILLHYWHQLVGNSEALIRLLPVTFGTLSIPSLYCLLIKLFPVNHKILNAPLVASILFALNPLSIYYSQELRMYSLSALLTILSWLFLLNILEKFDRRSQIFYILFTILNLYTFYGTLLILISQWLFVFFYHKKLVWRFSSLQFIVFLLFLPWLPTFVKQLQNGHHQIVLMPRWSSVSGAVSIKSLLLIPVKFSLGRISFDSRLIYGIVASISSAALIVLIAIGARLTKARVLVFWLISPLVIAVVLSLTTPMLGYWRYVFLLPSFASLIAVGLFRLPKHVRTIGFVSVALLWLSFNLYFWVSPRFHREDWRSAVSFLNHSSSASDVAVVNYSEPFAPLKYYPLNIEVYPSQNTIGTPRPDLNYSLASKAENANRVYVFDYLSDLTDPARRVRIELSKMGYVEDAIYNFPGVGLIYQYSKIN